MNRKRATHGLETRRLINEAPVLLTALMAGLLGSGHCLGMCGAIAGSAGGIGVSAGRMQVLKSALRFNLARIISYVLLGALSAFVLGSGGNALAVPGWGRALRIASSVLILLIGLQFLFNIALLQFIERAGGRLWARFRPSRVFSARPPVRELLLGLSWGFLPCGLVYTMLLTAASTGRATHGALVMAVFGAGTLPSMLGVTLFSGVLHQIRTEPVIRRSIGAGLVLLAGWSFLIAVNTGNAHIHHG
ncbi:MAG: sulfite exporter TauE/SafE family protein [Xanthomonadales bacterium]|nr:sulfite exporter TauE/SafE family protein [Xanthomonadales bacterium]